MQCEETKKKLQESRGTRLYIQSPQYRHPTRTIPVQTARRVPRVKGHQTSAGGVQ